MPTEGGDYEANAIAKARAAAEQLGCFALADDSGLEVDALDGAPGPYSARFGGPGCDDAGRVEHLLRELDGVPSSRRSARFVCLAALAGPAGELQTARGECPGSILETPRGVGGFGYDPIFQVSDQPKSLAELPSETKNKISHRARALEELFNALDPNPS